ncbi:MAG: sugar phosphate isomerase/epimerase [Bacillati bacterium ANGP1]|uniref:Sugar phosphate isomerase/epimerase n=2 Tax=Candidatus Segetimicrobium genomatis TaxID=2569760 RepID=A0A537M016_9BACT|nr:MAG: sugar phosphate isomerase/epimerase [Terrabacteria group bacterium ANGP1]
MSPAGYQSVIVRRGCAETTDAVTASAATRNHTTGRHFMVNTTPPRPCLVVSPISWPPDPLLAMLPLAVTPGARPRGLPCQRAKNIAGSTGRMRMRLGVIVAYARVHFGDEPTLEQYGAFADWAAQMQFAGIELAAFSLDHFARDFSDSQRLQRFRDHCQAKGLAITAFEAGFLRHMTVHQDPAVRAQAVTEVRKSVQVARSLGTDLIYLHSAPHPSWTIEFRRLYDEFSPPTRVEVPVEFSWDAAWAEYVGVIRDLVREAEAGGVRLALEVRPYEMVSNADGGRRLADAVGSPALGLVFDTAHFLVQKELLPVAIEKLRDRIFLVHLADNDGITDYHWAPGKGAVPWDGTLGALRKIGYAGFANIDVAGTYQDIDAEIRAGRDFILARLAGASR